MLLSKLFLNRDFIFGLSVGMGLLVPQVAQWTEPLMLPALALVMTLSTMSVPGSVFHSPRAIVIPMLLGILMNYGVLSGIILGLSAIFVSDKEIWNGFVILAAVPPAVAVIPFTEFLGGDKAYSLIGTTGAYLGALIIMPLMALGFFGSSFLEPIDLMAILAALIVAPFVLSRILLWQGIDTLIEPVKGGITNWCFFVVFYTIVGLNHDVFLYRPLSLATVAVIAVLSTFSLGLIIEWIAEIKRLDRKITTSLVLLGTLKNYGIAGGVSLAFFSKQTALPATVAAVFMIVYIIWLGFKRRWS
jgi:BASS family bile acid:Na+ symporter